MKLSDENNINSNHDLDRGILLEEKPKTDLEGEGEDS